MGWCGCDIIGDRTQNRWVVGSGDSFGLAHFVLSNSYPIKNKEPNAPVLSI